MGGVGLTATLVGIIDIMISLTAISKKKGSKELNEIEV